ncbi:hypothetical protein HK096_007967, partial [Nowakowskiella sp. JEL0078]
MLSKNEDVKISPPIPNTLLLLHSHILGESPHHLVDDIMNCVQDSATKFLAKSEVEIGSWIDTSSSLAVPNQYQQLNNATGRPILKSSEELQAEHERDKVKDEAMATIETLVHGSLDKVFDFFEFYLWRNFLSVPEELRGIATLPEFENLSKNVEIADITAKQEELNKLMDEYHEKMKFNIHLRLRDKEFREMIPALEKSVQQLLDFKQTHLDPSPSLSKPHQMESLIDVASKVTNIVNPTNQLADQILTRTMFGDSSYDKSSLRNQNIQQRILMKFPSMSKLLNSTADEENLKEIGEVRTELDREYEEISNIGLRPGMK